MTYHRAPHVIRILAVIFVASLAGCGSNDNGAFNDCGNGVVDSGEECDDGNLVDQDACLGTCKLNVCGDTFLNVGVEECEKDVPSLQCSSGEQPGKACLDNSQCPPKDPGHCDQASARCVGGPNAGSSCQQDADCPAREVGHCDVVTCQTLHFAGGTLGCTAQCTFDTSGCTGVGQSTPTPATTPSGGTSTATPGGTSGSPNPTPTSTPGTGAVCNAGDQIVVMASVDKPYGAVNIFIAYPPAANIPGEGNAQSVKDRVTFANAGGLTAVSDLANPSNTLSLSTVNTASTPAGLFATVTFDCLAGQPRPDASAFACSVQSASTPDGADIPNETCTVTIQ